MGTMYCVLCALRLWIVSVWLQPNEQLQFARKVFCLQLAGEFPIRAGDCKQYERIFYWRMQCSLSESLDIGAIGILLTSRIRAIENNEKRFNTFLVSIRLTIQTSKNHLLSVASTKWPSLETIETFLWTINGIPGHTSSNRGEDGAYCIHTRCSYTHVHGNW